MANYESWPLCEVEGETYVSHVSDPASQSHITDPQWSPHLRCVTGMMDADC